MASMHTKKCIVVTWLGEEQPGFLDFSYRIQSLAANYQLTVISTFAFTQPELMHVDAEYVVINIKKGRMAWLGYLWRCAKLIRQQKPDVVVLLHSMAAPVAMIISNIPSLCYWNEHPTHVAPEPDNFSPIKTATRSAVRWLMYQGARSATLVMPIGEAHRDDLIAHACKPNKMQMMYMGVAEAFSGVALTHADVDLNAPIKLIYVGSVSQDRGRDVMLEAMAIVNRQHKIAHLNIVGANDDQYQYCQTALQQLNAIDSVTIYQRVAGHKIPSFMRQADAGLCLWQDLPWYRFNPPTKLFEYLVAGLPVLASNIRTHTAYIEEGVNGFIFDYNSQSLAQTIQKLWQHRAQLPQIKNRTVESSNAYLWQNIEPDFLSAVKKVVL